MAIEKMFVKEGVKEMEMEKFLGEKFKRADYSRTEIQRTPMGTRIIVYANKPGLVIGRGGRKIDEITEEIKTKFGFENPLIDVREVDQPFLDAKIVAQRIVRDLEKGLNYKRVCNFYLDKVMEAGAIGIQIIAAGKLTGSERSRFQKFKKGFIAYSGDYAEKLVDKSYAQALLKAGIIGVKVKIMIEAPEEFSTRKKLAEEREGVEKEDVEKEEGAPEKEPNELKEFIPEKRIEKQEKESEDKGNKEGEA
jgi:small subunit ribosomal protein S3